MGTPGDQRIRVRCACGARLAAPPNAAGRRVRCPKCGQAVAVPSAAPAAPSLPSVGALPGDVAISDPVQVGTPPTITPTASPPPPRDDVYRLTPQAASPKPPRLREPAAVPTQVCPSCRKTLPASDVICVECGINIKTGRSLLITQDEGLDETYANTEGLLRWLSWVVPIGAYPVASEAFGCRKPWVVRTTAVATTIISLWFLAAVVFNPEPAAAQANLMLWSGQRTAAQTNPSHDDFVETEVRYQPHQLVTHAFLHGGLLHLASNLLFLLVLGSRVNALIGNILTVALYPLLAIASALAHLAATASEPLHPMLGASGAVMGLAGMYLVLFPIHKVHMAAWWRLGWIGAFQLNLKLFAVRGFWVVLFYIAFDVVYTTFGLKDDVAHWAHLGGFLTGAAAALLLLVVRLVNAHGDDLISVLLGKHAWKLLGTPNRAGRALW